MRNEAYVVEDNARVCFVRCLQGEIGYLMATSSVLRQHGFVFMD